MHRNRGVKVPPWEDMPGLYSAVENWKIPSNDVPYLTSRTPVYFDASECMKVGLSFIAIDPVLIYNPNARGEGEAGFGPKHLHDPTKADFFWGRDNWWRYYGVYQYSGRIIMKLNQIKQYLELPPGILSNLVARTIRSPEQGPTKHENPYRGNVQPRYPYRLLHGIHESGKQPSSR
ncbi:hypothetical protein QCA50_009182 [Cerrena zonata]|uniref:Uncharacterized protein n=1 Tax=Cerrena zonata TaxID=2478898 RepID=A0AAW0GDD7_9APHY